MSKKDKMADATPRRLCVAHSPFNEDDFCGEGTGHFRCILNEHIIIAWSFWHYIYAEWFSKYRTRWCSLMLVAYADNLVPRAFPLKNGKSPGDEVATRKLQKQEDLPRSPREELQLVAVLFLGVKSLSLLQERNMLLRVFSGTPFKIVKKIKSNQNRSIDKIHNLGNERR